MKGTKWGFLSEWTFFLPKENEKASNLISCFFTSLEMRLNCETVDDNNSLNESYSY